MRGLHVWGYWHDAGGQSSLQHRACNPISLQEGKLIANKILDVIRTMLCKDREVQSFEYTEARKAYFTEQMICEILIALEQTAISLDMEYDDRQKAMSTDLSKAARKEWYLRHKDKGMEP